jgi:hypothetical protein
MKITLTDSEMYMAGQIGLRRTLDSISAKHKEVNNSKPEDRWNHSIEGTFAELAFCKAFEIYWGKELYNNFHGADIGQNIQIRHTSWKKGKLLIKTEIEREHPEHNYVLVRGIAPNFEIVGWIKGQDGMKQRYLDDPVGKRGEKPRPAYFIPSEDLNPLDTLEIIL